MDGAEILTTIAQLGVGVAGFSGIAIAFNRQPGRLSDVEAFRVIILFATSLAAVFLSLIPFALHYFGLPDFIVWRVSSGLCTLFEFIFVLSRVRPTRRFLREQPEIFSLPQLGFLIFGHIVNTVLQLGNTLDLFGRNHLALFLFGVLWLLFHGAFQFGRILFVQPMSGGAVSHSERR